MQGGLGAFLRRNPPKRAARHSLKKFLAAMTPSTPGRNTPCPCGSGKKYKRCCGNAAALPTADTAIISSSGPRPCGDCSLCCDGWVKTRVLEHDIDEGRPCPFSSGHHCTIHDARPNDPCRIFHCGWAEPDSSLPDWLKPTQSGVIVLTGRSSWRGRPVDILVATRRNPNQRVLDWFKARALREQRPFIFQYKEEWFGFGPPDFQAGIKEKGQALFEA